MKTLLFLNGPEGSQTGVEDGFSQLVTSGHVSELKWFYLGDAANKNGLAVTLSGALQLAESFQPKLIVVFHISKLSITAQFVNALKNLSSNPILAYDEGDMYGSWSKPISTSMKLIIRQSDVVSLRGLGGFYEEISKLNKNIIYTPHNADIAKFDKDPYLLRERNNKLVLIGNKVTSRLGPFRRLPGAKERECFVRAMGEAFPTDFALYGNGWVGFKGNRGPVDFFKQLDVYRDSWITVAYEHYPEIPYYFSNRLPISLLAGSLYVCHRHKGYENMFKNCDFIFFFDRNVDAVDLVNYIHSLSKEDLFERSQRARAFSLKYFTPSVVWGNFFRQVMELVCRNRLDPPPSFVRFEHVQP